MHPGETGHTIATVLVDAINTGSTVIARITVTFIHIDLTILAGSARQTVTMVGANSIHTMTTVLARIRFTLIDLRLAEVSGETGIADALERIVAIDTFAAMTRIRIAIVDIDFARKSCVAGWTFTRITTDRIVTNAIIPTRLRLTIVDVYLTT